MRGIVFLVIMLVSLSSVGQTTAVDSLYNPKEFRGVLRYEDNSIRQIFNVDSKGKRHGEFYSFHSDGSIWGYGEFKHGLRHGEWVQYRPNGELVGVQFFKKGDRVGIWSAYDESGELIATREY